jgi:hypothetical protein
MHEFKQIILVAHDPACWDLSVVRVLYLNVAAMSDADRALWTRFETKTGYQPSWKDCYWNEDEIYESDADVCAWMGVRVRCSDPAVTIGQCFIEGQPGSPPGPITGVYCVNLTWIPE